MPFKSLFLYEHSDSVTVGNIFLVAIAMVFVTSWIMFWYFLSHKEFFQLSSISISCLLISLSLSFVVNVLYYVLDDVIPHIAYGIIIFFIMILYGIGHLIMLTSFLWRMKVSIRKYKRNGYYNTLINISFCILPFPFLSLCIIVIMPTFYYITALLNIWILLEVFLSINILYLYLIHLSYFHIKYNNQEYNINDTKNSVNSIISSNDLHKMIRNTWNIIWTLIISLICMICIVVIDPPFHNLSHVILCINIFIHILCIISFIEYNPSLLNKLCSYGDYICGCNICCKQCIIIAFKKEYSNPMPNSVIDGTGNKIYRHHEVQNMNKIRTRSEATWNANPSNDGRTAFRHKQVIDDTLGMSQHSNDSNTPNSADDMLQRNGEKQHKITITRWIDSDDTDNGENDEEEKNMLLLETDDGDNKKRRKSHKNKKRKQHENIHRSLLCGESIMEYTDKWLKLNADTFNIRPKDYYTSDNKKRKNAKKVPSINAMYDVFAVDAYKMNEKLKFMEAMKKYDIDIDNIIDGNGYDGCSDLPYLLIVNVVLPLNIKKKNEENELETANGIQITIYSKLSIESEKILNEVENGSIHNLPESMALFSRFIDVINNDNNNNNKDDDILRNAMKLTMRVNNLGDSSLSFVMKKLVKKANGQSIALKTERVSYFIDELKQYLVIDIDGYTLSKQVLTMWNTARSCLDSIIYDIGFHIGGHCQSDLPEQILLCTQINKLAIHDMILINEMKIKQKPSMINLNINQQRRQSYKYMSDKEIVVSSPEASPSPSPRPRISRYVMDSEFD